MQEQFTVQPPEASLSSHFLPKASRLMEARIINRGRGPEISGTRITVYDVWDYAKQNWHRDAIAATLRLSSAQVAAALEYIEQHRDQVLADYAKILAREARGNSPELQAKLDATHAKFQAQMAERRRQQRAAVDERDPGRP